MNYKLKVEGMNGELNELMLDDGIGLRACGNLVDSVDLMTCTLTRNLSELILNGSENWVDITSNENVDEIEFFRKLDWIIEYNSVKDLSEEEIIELGKSIAEEKNNIAKKYNAMSLEERKKNSYLVDECEMLEFKMFSLRDTLWFMQGQLKFVLPEGIENLKSFENKKEKGLRKILSRFRKK